MTRFALPLLLAVYLLSGVFTLAQDAPSYFEADRNPIFCRGGFYHLHEQHDPSITSEWAGGPVQNLSELRFLPIDGSPAYTTAMIYGLDSNLTCSPNGQTIAYTTYDREMKESTIWKFEGMVPEALATTNCPLGGRITFSPEGQKISFVGCNPDDPNFKRIADYITVFDLATQQLSYVYKSWEYFTWLDNDRLLVEVRYENESGKGKKIALLTLSTGDIKLLTDGEEMSVSPNGQFFSFNELGYLSLMPEDGSYVYTYPFDPINVKQPIWVNNNTIVFVGWVKYPTSETTPSGVFLVTLGFNGGSEFERLLSGTYHEVAASSDGRYLAVTRSTAIGSEIELIDLTAETVD